MNFTLCWHSANYLAFYVTCPACKSTIYFGNKKCCCSSNYGFLELEMNGEGNNNPNYPVDHIFYDNIAPVGRYQIKVNFVKKKCGSE